MPRTSAENPEPLETEAAAPRSTASEAALRAENERLRARVAALEAADSTRERAERALRSHLEFLETLLDTIPSPVFYKDCAGRYLGCNRAFAERVLGLKKADILGRTLFDLPDVIPPSLAQVYHEHDERLIEEPGVQCYEAQVRAAGGKLRDIVFHKATFETAEGDVGGIVGVMVDITDHRQAEHELRRHRDHLDQLVVERTAKWKAANTRLEAEIGRREETQEALRRSEERYRRLVENLNDGLAIQDAEGRITYVNEAFSRMLGYPPAEIAGKAFGDFLDASNAAVFARELAARRGGSSRPYELTWRRKDGRPLTTIMSPRGLLDPAGAFGGSFAVVTDISERRYAEEALRRSEARLRVLMDALPFEIWARDADGRYVLQNAASRASWGDVVGRRPQDLGLAPEVLEARQAVDREGLGGRMTRGEIVRRIDDQDVRLVSLVAPVLTSGRVQGMVGMLVDLRGFDAALHTGREAAAAPPPPPASGRRRARARRTERSGRRSEPGPAS